MFRVERALNPKPLRTAVRGCKVDVAIPSSPEAQQVWALLLSEGNVLICLSLCSVTA